jgi:hypothetical protein
MFEEEEDNEGFMGTIGLDFDELQKGMEEWQKNIEEVCSQW